MKKLLLLIAKNPRLSLSLVVVFQVVSIFWAMVAGAVLDEMYPKVFPYLFWSGIGLALLAWILLKEDLKPFSYCTRGLHKIKLLYSLAFFGLFVFVTGNYPHLQKQYATPYSIADPIQTKQRTSFVLIEMEQQKKGKRGWFTRVRDKINKGAFQTALRVKRWLTPDPYKSKRSRFLAGVIFIGIVFTGILGYLACSLACNGMGVLAIAVFVGGELFYGFLAYHLVKKYWTRWRPREKCRQDRFMRRIDINLTD
jgi:hypothetical protein